MLTPILEHSPPVKFLLDPSLYTIWKH